MIRFAGNALRWLKGDATAADLALRIGMDGIGAGMNALSTPGDFGDKLITFGTDLGMSAGGGLAVGRLGGKNQAIGTMLDMAGSYGGAMGSIPVSEKLLQGKDLLMGGKGESPWQRMSREQQEQFAQQMEIELLQKYGLLTPGMGHNIGQANVANVGVFDNGIA